MQTKENELYHYGRLGMKWYQHIFGDVDARAKYSAAKASLKEERRLVQDKTAMRSLSDDQIKERIERIKLEDQYADLVLRPKTSKGKDVVSDILKSLGTNLATEFGKSYGKNLGNYEGTRKVEKRKIKDDKKDKVKANFKASGKKARDEIVQNVRDYVFRKRYGLEKQLN